MKSRRLNIHNRRQFSLLPPANEKAGHEDLINSLRHYSLPIVLVGGSSPKEGRVEINHEGRHGTVCNDGWDDKDAFVVCTMLGYKNGTALHGIQNFGPGVGEILLDDVECKGNETNILDCKHSGLGISNCFHEEDAAVRCDDFVSNFDQGFDASKIIYDTSDLEGAFGPFD